MWLGWGSDSLGVDEDPSWLPAAETWIEAKTGTWESRCLGVESMVASLSWH